MAFRIREFFSSLRTPRADRLLRRAPFWLMAALLAGALALTAMSGWYVLQAVRQSKERELGTQLSFMAQMAADRMEESYGPALFRLSSLSLDLWPPDEKAGEFIRCRDSFLEEDLPQLRQFLTRMANRLDLRSVMIVDVHGRFIADSRAPASRLPFSEFPLIFVDAAEARQAAITGLTQTTAYYAVRDVDLPTSPVAAAPSGAAARRSMTEYMRAYAPLSDERERVYAFLRIEPGAAQFEGMRGIQRHLALVFAAELAILAAIGLIFFRLLRYALRAEKAVAQSERLQAVSTLAAGLAHEARNPLGIIRSSAEGLVEEISSKEDSAEAVSLARDMVEEVDRVNGLITQFLDFARPSDSAAWGPVDVAQAMRSVAALARKEMESQGLRVEFDFDPTAPPVQANEKALRQVFLNLLLNARDATPPGGTIALRTRARRGRLFISVEDTGRGIARADLRRVFDPFFTTKASGLGLGLSLSRNIVEQFGGELTIRSQEGAGTTVEVNFRV